MKSTGEVMGKDSTLEKALYKALIASGIQIPNYGSVLLTVADKDKEEGLAIAKRFHAIGYNILATEGTAGYLKEASIPAKVVGKSVRMARTCLMSSETEKRSLSSIR